LAKSDDRLKVLPTPVVSVEKRYVIVLDDDPLIPKLLEKIIAIKCVWFSSIDELVQTRQKWAPSAVFIDIHLGRGENGLTIIPLLKDRWPDSLLLVITADLDSKYLKQALLGGADDFIRKPFDPLDLRARIQSRIGDRIHHISNEWLEYSHLKISPVLGCVQFRSRRKPLKGNAMAVLMTMVSARGTLVTRNYLRYQVWGGATISENALDKQVSEVRRVLKSIGQPVRLRSVYGKGWVLSA